MFQIWRHFATGERYLVALHDDHVLAAAGPLRADEDPTLVLATLSNQRHNPYALLEMQRAPERYIREYTSEFPGEVRTLPLPEEE